ncbi:MAG: hypothetical protein WC611_05475 [Candidatus Neomarinimicrobiota bacterium]|jgi:hypothetical protein
MNKNLSERIIEDILSADKSILSELLLLDSTDLSLIARQKSLRTGKLDLLYLHKSDLILIELKIVDFYDGIISQINGYYNDLKELQKQHKLIDTNIKKVILVPGFKSKDIEKCKQESIQIVDFKPDYVLTKFYENFKELSYFLRIQSGDYGVVRIGLINSTLQMLASGKSINEITNLEKRSKNTIKNRLSVASLLGLVAKFKGEFFLTDFGNCFIEASKNIDDRLSEEQVEILSSFVRENPFYSSITYTILTILETVFVLSKNTYPVPFELVKDYFVKSVGKTQTWKAEKARTTATYIFVNYACELEFLAEVGNNFYLTPRGIQAILLLQLNRSIKLIETQK